MFNIENPNKILNDVVQRANTDLKSAEPSPFSTQGFSFLREKIAEFIKILVNESIRIFKIQRSDTVSASHVERAVENLMLSSARRFYRHLGTVGGILLGASLSNFLAMAQATQYSLYWILISAVLGIFGAFMIALHIAKD